MDPVPEVTGRTGIFVGSSDGLRDTEGDPDGDASDGDSEGDVEGARVPANSTIQDLGSATTMLADGTAVGAALATCVGEVELDGTADGASLATAVGLAEKDGEL